MARLLHKLTLATLLACAAIGCGDDPARQTLIVPSDAMTPALLVGERTELDTGVYRSGRPTAGQVVQFRAPEGVETGACGMRRPARKACSRPTPPDRELRPVLRVIAGPGDRVAFVRGVAVVNGKPETYRRLLIADELCELCELPAEITVPAGHVFVAGDNRSGTRDSRAFGPIPITSVIGKVEL